MTLLPKQSNNKNPIDLYGEIVDDLPGLICFGNRLGGYFNKQWRDYTGAIAGEHGAADWLDALHPDDRERLAAQWRRDRGPLLVRRRGPPARSQRRLPLVHAGV